MKNWNIIAQKAIQVAHHQVTAQKHDDPTHEKPHQVLFSVTIEGIERAELWCYPQGVTGNRDCDYASFDDASAGRLVAKFLKQLASPRHAAAKLAAGN